MGLLGRGVPASVRSRLERGERVLAHAPAAGGGAVLAATTRALHLPDGRTVPWEDIDRARWSREELAFIEEGSGEHAVPLREGVDYRSVAEAVAERVTSTILVNRFVPFPRPDSSTGFRLVARRSPGGTEASWRIHLGEGLDEKDPRLPDAVSRALDLLHDQMGV
ncbi:hypothetical protein ACFVWN_05300 [Nocardiopsis flavescens]|uniref:Uncharacterized protein n=1 Tax=Nocardiopsis flavescens TaxID=758803 RepID=A0A1M6EIP9_9ACTN|nr:hypothetical protein [Nocardiopsis flavescens]SHI85313.1 hypothetical protein SAMN05421803_102293 [Nocardiopsis flavescens]